jgi:hypothetical protein
VIDVKENNNLFLSILKKIRVRLGTKKAFDNLFMSLAAGLGASVIAVVLSRFLPIYNLYYYVALAIGVICLAALIVSVFMVPSLYNTALSVDACGLKERTVTAFELLADSSNFAQFQKKDALEHLKKLDYKKHISLTPNYKYIIASIVLALGITGSAFLPNPMTDIALERHKLSMLKKEEVKKIDKVEKELSKNEKLTPLEKSELEKKLSELKKDLKEAESEKEVRKAVEKADKKLEMAKTKYDKEELKKLSETLAKSDLTKNISDLINTGQTKQLKEAIKALAEAMKNLNSEQIKQFAENLDKLSKEIKNNEELKEALAGLAQKMASGEFGDLSEELEQFTGSIQELMNSDEFREAVSQMQSDLNEGEPGAISGQMGGQGGNQPGSGNQQGQGQGQGAGPGAGSGTSMGEENPTGTGTPSGGLNKKQGSERKEGEYEKIFTPKTLGGEGDTSQITGKKNNSGNSEKVNTEKGINVRGEAVPYNQVLGSYKQKAAESMGSSEIPEGMREIIKSYFSSLEE